MTPTSCSYPILREAVVLNVNDNKSLGRVQLKVLPELEKISDKECPWAFPLGAGVHGKDFSLPLVGSVVYAVVFNRFWNEIAFIPSVISSPRKHLFQDWVKSKKPSITDMNCTPTEASFSVREWEDGFTEYHDSKNSEHGFLHPSGTFVTIDKDGQVSVQSVKNLNFHDKNGNLAATMDSSTGNVSVHVKGAITINSAQKTDIESPSTTLKGGDVTVDGAVSATGQGALCGLPFCLFSGTPQVGPIASGCK